METGGSGLIGRSINFKFTALVLGVTFFFLIAVFSISSRVMRSFALNTAEEVALTVLEGTESRILVLFEGLESMSRSLAATQAVIQVDEPEMRDLFIASMLAWQRYLRAIYLGTEDGAMYEWGHGEEFTNFEPAFPAGYDPRQRPWYATALKNEGFSVSPPYRYASVSALGITCVLPVRKPGGELVGVLGVDILLEQMKSLLDDLDIPKGGRAYILGANGEIIAGSAETEPSVELPLKRLEAPNIAEQLRNIKGSFKTSGADGMNLYYYRKIQSVDWFVLVVFPYAAIMASVDRLLTVITLIEILLMLMLTAALSFISGLVISSPLRGIVAVVNRLESGERDARIAVRSDDEFALLGRELNKLVDAVEEYSSSLEAKVAERTEEAQRLEQENTRLRITEERQRIYRDMHDSIGANLTNIFFCNNVARSAAELRPDKLRELFEGIENNCMEAVQNLKTIIGGMGTSAPAVGAFVVNLSSHVQQRLRHKGIELTYNISPVGVLEKLPPLMKSELTKIFDELVSNVLKHSEATRVVFGIRAGKGGLVVKFQDDGIGFDVPSAVSAGYGLSNIEYRVKSLRGDFKLASKTGRGTRFTITFPMSPAREEELSS